MQRDTLLGEKKREAQDWPRGQPYPEGKNGQERGQQMSSGKHSQRRRKKPWETVVAGWGGVAEANREAFQRGEGDQSFHVAGRIRAESKPLPLVSGREWRR